MRAPIKRGPRELRYGRRLPRCAPTGDRQSESARDAQSGRCQLDIGDAPLRFEPQGETPNIREPGGQADRARQARFDRYGEVGRFVTQLMPDCTEVPIMVM